MVKPFHSFQPAATDSRRPEFRKTNPSDCQDLASEPSAAMLEESCHGRVMDLFWEAVLGEIAPYGKL
jgi:hypothetical protein